jgi:hypothetical protein
MLEIQRLNKKGFFMPEIPDSISSDFIGSAAKKGFTGLIRITQVPAGEAPLEIRQHWVDLILPCMPACGYQDEMVEAGVLTGKEEKPRSTFCVPQEEAFGILAEHSPEAFLWWNMNGYPEDDPDACLGFGECEAQIISGVQYQVIRNGGEAGDGDENNPLR